MVETSQTHKTSTIELDELIGQANLAKLYEGKALDDSGKCDSCDIKFRYESVSK